MIYSVETFSACSTVSPLACHSTYSAIFLTSSSSRGSTRPGNSLVGIGGGIVQSPSIFLRRGLDLGFFVMVLKLSQSRIAAAWRKIGQPRATADSPENAGGRDNRAVRK